MRRMQVRSGVFMLAILAIVIYLFLTGEETWGLLIGCLMGVSLVIYLAFQAMDRRRDHK